MLRLPTAAKKVLRKLVPECLLKQQDIVKRLGPSAGRTYATLRLRDVIGMRPSSSHPVLPCCRSFLFVCYGNIMRSAMAEAVMKEQLSDAGLKHIEVTSAGLHAVPGREAHPWAVEAAADMGISLIHHRARLLTAEMITKADCIFAMDFQNKAELLTLYPEAAPKICMLSAYAQGRRRGREIPDPYTGDLETTKSCYRELRTCIRNLMATTISSSESKEKGTELAHQ